MCYSSLDTNYFGDAVNLVHKYNITKRNVPKCPSYGVGTEKILLNRTTMYYESNVDGSMWEVEARFTCTIKHCLQEGQSERL